MYVTNYTKSYLIPYNHIIFILEKNYQSLNGSDKGT